MKINLYKKFGYMSTPMFVFIITLFIIGFLAISFLGFTFGYWLITLILAGFFNFILPFSWWYSLGAWLIALIFGLFVNFKINFKE